MMDAYNQNVLTIMTNRILFLDLDGVLNSIDFYKRRGGMVAHKSFFDRHADELDPIAVKLLKEFVLENDIKIVISSTWRLLLTIEEIIALFEMRGWEDIPIIDFTPEIYNVIRGEEIQDWLEKYEHKVENYVILDDDSDFTKEQLKNNFVHVSGQTGLLPEHIEQMKTILRKT